MQEVLLTTLQAVLAIVIPILTGYAIRFLNAHAEQAKSKMVNENISRYVTEVSDAVSTAVLHTAQTYTDTLKKSGVFTAENQREAFTKAAGTAQTLLTAEAARFIEDRYGDVAKFLAAKIDRLREMLQKFGDLMLVRLIGRPPFPEQRYLFVDYQPRDDLEKRLGKFRFSFGHLPKKRNHSLRFSQRHEHGRSDNSLFKRFGNEHLFQRYDQVGHPLRASFSVAKIHEPLIVNFGGYH